MTAQIISSLEPWRNPEEAGIPSWWHGPARPWEAAAVVGAAIEATAVGTDCILGRRAGYARRSESSIPGGPR